jgi:hypothetical protein
LHFYIINNVFCKSPVEKSRAVKSEEQRDQGICLSIDTFLAVGTFCQLDGAPPHFSHHVYAFLDGEFPDCWMYDMMYNVNHLHTFPFIS